MPLSMAQQTALAVVPKITGGISCISSMMIAAHILLSKSGTDKKKLRTKFFHRLILGISLSDISTSLFSALSTWPIPKDSGVLWAVGNKTSCSVQGFFLQFAISSALYNASLSIYYLLAIKYGWKDFELFKWEAAFHGVPICWGLGTAIASISLDILHNANLWCFIGKNPENPEQDVDIYRMVFFYGPLWIAIGVVSILLVLVFAYVREITMKSEKFSPTFVARRISYVKAQADDLYENHGLSKETLSKENTDENVVIDVTDGGQQQGAEEEFMDNENTTAKRAIELANTDENGAIDVTNGGQQQEVVEEGKETVNTTATQQPDIQEEQQQTQQQRHTKKHKNNSLQSFAKRRREVALQCLQFCISFYITWIPITCVRILQLAETPVPYGLLLLAAIMTPLQGLPNFLIYLFPLLRKRRLISRSKINPRGQT